MRRVCLLAVVIAAAACGGDAATPDAGTGPDAFIPDDAAHLPDGAPLVWVDFSASGCAIAQANAAPDAATAAVTCTGPAALTVTFTPLASGPVSTWAWAFSDGAVSSQATPTHTFVLPGTYDVTLAVAGPGGSATLTRFGYIVAAPAVLGAACSQGPQCASGSCACGNAACDASASLCASACGTSCAGVCGALGGGWDAQLCLQPCSSDDQCEPGRACAVVAAAAGGWVQACVPAGSLAPIGTSCATASGLDDGACAGADCLGIGARGMCVVTCPGGASCPADTACATFGNGTTACVPKCDVTHPCGDDPWLACEAPGASGPWGFTLAGGGTACAPRSCGAPSDCPGGSCVAGHCTT